MFGIEEYLWAGEFTSKLYSRLGGTPIHRGKVDWKGLNSIRNLFANGRFPLAIAPEGATNGHNEIIGPLEPGIGQMGLWCLDDLEKQDRKEDVYILPLGIQYSYIEEDWNRLETLLDSFIQDLSAKDVLIPFGLTDGMNPTLGIFLHLSES
ncbi:MAG: 1-acyl-sn-glycerol-3-phosphate acyltransferase [Leptospiraceae bacterium]|nr:1-acyl-sn-glycerol-3-phosphate acyltransferase [Leptospiraceae bacterium]